MRNTRLLLVGAFALAAACSSDRPASPTEPQAASTNEIRTIYYSSAAISLFSAVENTLPSTNSQVLTLTNQYGLIGNQGIFVGQPFGKVTYSKGATGWLRWKVGIGAFSGTVTFSVVGSLPLGVYTATVPITVPGAINNQSITVTWTVGGDCLPPAFTGTKAWWYGNSLTGNFNYGNTAGTLVSPAFSLPGSGTQQLTFQTFFEIEWNVSPFSFDFMEAALVNASSGATVLYLGRINNNSLPTTISFTGCSGPTTSTECLAGWVQATQSITGVPAGSYRLKFIFTTNDGAYNNYRGWLIDNIRIASGSTTFFFDPAETTVGWTASPFTGTAPGVGFNLVTPAGICNTQPSGGGGEDAAVNAASEAIRQGNR